MRLSIDFSGYLRVKTILLSIAFVLMVMATELQWLPLQAAFVAVCFGIFFLFNKEARFVSEGERSFVALLVIAAGAAMVVNVFRTPTSALHFIMLCATMLCALAATSDPKAYVRASFIVLLFGQGVVLSYLRVRGLSGFPLEGMLPDTSANGITACIVLLQINYLIANMLVRKATAPVSSSITFFICIIGYGRGSIIAATAVLLISLLFMFRRVPGRYAIIATVALISASSLLIITNFEIIYNYMSTSTKIGTTGFYDAPRAAMWSEYLNSTRGTDIIFGTSFERLLVDRFYNGNPHNAFVRGHHYLGLIYIAMMVMMALRPLLLRFPLIEKSFYALLLAILLLRASTESILFPTSFDLLYWSLFFLFARTPVSARRRAASVKARLIPATLIPMSSHAGR